LRVSIGIILIVVPFIFYLLLAFTVRALCASRPSSSQDRIFTPFISVVIPTYNEVKMIEKRVKNLENLEYPANHLEAIFVDGASSDGTPQIIERLRTNRPFIHLIQQSSRQGYNSAIYEGICQASFDIVVISDAGSLFHPKAISSVVKHLSDPSIGAATGRPTYYNPDETLATRLFTISRGPNEQLRIAESKIDSTIDVNGELLAFRKEIGLKLQPRVTLPDNATFDTAVAYTARSLGLRVIFEPDAVAYGYAPTAIREYLTVQIRHGTIFAGTLWRFRSMILNPAFGYFGLVILPSRFLVLFVFPWMLLAAPFVLLWESLLDPITGTIATGIVGLATCLILFAPKIRRMLLYFGLSQILNVIANLRLLLGRQTQIIHTAPSTRK
jgi:cellulose synthase/poly-beta-1,6-N-acetylglucosamine synthase-like glycosyltransferase